MDFPGVQQLWRVRQVAFNRAGLPETTEVRYFLSSIPPSLLSAHEQLALVRLHCLGEDDRQPCQASKDAIEVVAWLRVIGFNLLAAWRSRAPRKDQQHDLRSDLPRYLVCSDPSLETSCVPG